MFIMVELYYHLMKAKSNGVGGRLSGALGNAGSRLSSALPPFATPQDILAIVLLLAAAAFMVLTNPQPALPGEAGAALGKPPCVLAGGRAFRGTTAFDRFAANFEARSGIGAAVFPEARVSWRHSIMGNVELHFIDAETGEADFETLGESWVGFSRPISADKGYVARVVFVPFEKYAGESADFTVHLRGSALGGEAASAGCRENEISFDVKIVNLEQCVRIVGAGETLRLSQDSGASFTIDTSLCGNTPVQFYLREANSTESKISISPSSFNLTPSKAAEKVAIRGGEIPGMHGIEVFAKVGGYGRKKIGTIDVFVELDENSVFALDKYAVTLIGAGSVDSVKVENSQLYTGPFKLNASVCDFYPASYNWFRTEWGNEAGAGKSQSALFAAIPAMQRAKEASNQLGLAKNKLIFETKEDSEKAVESEEESLEAQGAAAKSAEQSAQSAGGSHQKAVQGASAAEAIEGGSQSLGANSCSNSGQIQSTARELKQRAKQAEEKSNSALEKASACTDSATAAEESGRSARGYSKSALDSALSSMDFAAVREFYNASQSHRNSRAEMIKAKENQQSALAFISTAQLFQREAKANCTESKELEEEAKKEAEEAAAKLSELQGQVSAAVSACSAACNPIYNPSACTEAGKASSYLSTVGGSSPQVSAVPSAIDETIQQLHGAIEDGERAIGKNDATIKDEEKALESKDPAIEAAETLSVEEEASSMAASFSDDFNGMVGSAVISGFASGAFEGGVYGEERCEKRASFFMPDYTINLKEDALPIEIENEFIGAEWVMDEAKVFGVFEKQLVPILFKNNGLSSEEPLYVTITLRARRYDPSHEITIPRESTGFGLFNVPKQASGIVSQKFRIKIKTMPNASAGQASFDNGNACRRGLLFGETGESALPNIRFVWGWGENEISETSCDARFGDSFYCDATQFSIMLSKKLQALREFLEANRELECPPNPAIRRLVEMASSNYEHQEPRYCWLPRTTDDYDGMPVLVYFIEHNGDKIEWTDKIQSIADVLGVLRFNAFLMRDSFNPDFKEDFAEYYTRRSFFGAPFWFADQPSGKFADYFKQPQRLRMVAAFSSSPAIPDAGLYEVFAKIDFGSDWGFFGQSGGPDASATIRLYLKKRGAFDSIFYYLPFNGNVGVGTANGRQGYGLSFLNRDKPLLIAEQRLTVKTEELGSSEPLFLVETSFSEDFKKLNSLASNRGALSYASITGLHSAQLQLSPTRATPVLMKITQERTPADFSARYALNDGYEPLDVGGTAGFWTGIGECIDFSGWRVVDLFFERPDSKAQKMPSPQYAFSWKYSKFDGNRNVHLKSIFFVPTGEVLSVVSKSGGKVGFISPDFIESARIVISGIAGMPYNNSANASDTIVSLEDLFGAVKSNEVCMTKSANAAWFWWNQGKLEELRGLHASFDAIEEAAASECIR
jgi:hypothetical protein